MDAEDIKRTATEFGADLVGIASAKTLNAFPPDPLWPQTPDRISPSCKSIIVIVSRIPVAAFRAKSGVAVQYLDMLVLRRMDRIAYRLAEVLEREGHPSFVTAAQETDWDYKRASYGRLSTRHLGIEAGLGTFGLEVNILTPEFGPRIYLTGILTDLELEPDEIMTEQVCIGESCSRCLYSCPTDAVKHFGIDKRNCAKEAQEFGFMTSLPVWEKFIDGDAQTRKDLLASRDIYGFWQGLLRVVGSFGDCPRCLAVCPVGNDYHAHLADNQKVIPEKNRRQGRQGQSVQAGAQGRRRDRRAEPVERTLGRAGRLSGHRRATIAGVQKSASRANCRVRSCRGRGARVMVAVFQAPIAADDIKQKALALGCDLAGIADGEVMDAHPPDHTAPRRPSDISDYDAGRAIVLVKRLNIGTTRLTRWDERHKYYNDELTLTALEEASLELVLWLEDKGYPALIIPPTHVDPWSYQGDPNAALGTILSLTHAAVEAGLGTLGLNQQLLTPQYGPRVIVSAVLSSVPVVPDSKLEAALCLGPTCGRCLLACPGDVIKHWDRDWAACERYRSPHGFQAIVEHLERIIDEPDLQAKKDMLRSREQFYIWQSILRGAGVVTGCRRCQDVCPVGEDYARLKDAVDEIAEASDGKRTRLDAMGNGRSCR